MNDDYLAITNLLYSYADYIDTGNLESAAALFVDAKIKVPNNKELIGSDSLLEMWRNLIKIYPDGTPKTHHIVTNIIIEFDDNYSRASVRSNYTVYQATDDFPLQLVAAGRYYDRFERMDGSWKFRFRDLCMLDMVGNLSAHLKENIK